MLDHVISLLAPHSCCSCGDLGSILCESCKNDITYDDFCYCLRCDKPTASGAICRKCQSVLAVEAAWCVGSRGDALKLLLDAYKFRSSREASRHLTDMLDTILPLFDSDVVVTQAPTAARHRRTRGFDHVGVVAKGLAKRRGMKYRETLRVRGSDMQHMKSRAERREHAQKNIYALAHLPSKVLLIDDIYTTGATIETCVERLKSAGASTVYVAVLARSVLG